MSYIEHMQMDKDIVRLGAFKGENELEFLSRFGTKESCLEYLANYKWRDGFYCTSCGCTESYQSKQNKHYKICKSCIRMVSPTSQTLFHKVKFGIEKAFYIVFKMSATTKSVSAEQLAKTVGINRKSALLFQHKVRAAMASDGDHPMKGNVEVDEAFVGGYEEGKVGRGADKKALISVAIQKNGTTGIKRMYAMVIQDASTTELKKIFDKHISKQAEVLTDKWRSYTRISEDFSVIQEKSDPGKNFKLMHRAIQQLKSWIRGIHHSVDSKYLQGYLDEFCYRINRSIHKETIFDNLLQRMTYAQPMTKNQWKSLNCI
jgi:transposase-like protein